MPDNLRNKALFEQLPSLSNKEKKVALCSLFNDALCLEALTLDEIISLNLDFRHIDPKHQQVLAQLVIKKFRTDFKNNQIPYAEREKYIELFLLEDFRHYCQWLQPEDILSLRYDGRLMLTSFQSPGKKRLTDFFNRFSDYDRNKAALQYIGRPISQQVLADLQLSPPTILLLTKRESYNTTQQEALKSLATYKLNYSIYQKYLNVSLPRSDAENSLIHLWNALEKDTELNKLLLPIKTKTSTTTSAAPIVEKVTYTHSQNHYLNNHLIGPGKVKRVVKRGFLFTQTLPSVLNTPHNSYYILNIKLGKGGWGRVKLAKNAITGEWCAIKIIQYMRNDLNTKRRAQYAASNTKKLGILKDEWTIEKEDVIKHYLVLPFVPGQSFFSTLFKDTTPEITDDSKKDYKKNDISFDKKIDYAISAIEIVMYYHNRGYTICDIKPENFLDDNGHLELIDADNIRHCSSPPFVVAATPCYIAPELYSGKVVQKQFIQNFSTDVYALGSLLIEIFSTGPTNSSLVNGSFPHMDRYLNNQPSNATELRIWQICKNLHSTTAENRPALSTVLEEFKHIKKF